MVHTMTGERTIAGGGATTNKFEPAIRTRVGHGVPVEIDKPRLGCDAMGVVAGAARRFLINDVESMAAILA